MTSKLISMVVQKVTVDYCRLSIVRNQDGFLTKTAVQTLIYQQTGIRVISGSNLSLRVHFELFYKKDNCRYIYICNSFETLLKDMKEQAFITDFSISDVFPLFADKSLLRKQDYEVLERLYSQVSTKRIAMLQCKQMIDSISCSIEEERKRSADYMLSCLKSLTIDWNQMYSTMESLCDIVVKAVKENVYDTIEDNIEIINQGFQSWIDASYFSVQNSNPLLKAKCVNKILPHIADKYDRDDKVALIVVDGFAFWQYLILRDYLHSQNVNTKDDVTLAWLPSITMLSRQAIFRGDRPLQEYKQSPENERKLWNEYWQSAGLSLHEIQYVSDKDEFAINEGVKRFAYVTVEMDEKMHSSSDYKDLCSLTENWCTRITGKIKTIINAGYTIYLTTDHGSVLSHGWRSLTFAEKVFLYKDGSRGKRHLIYKDIHEQTSFYEQCRSEIPLLNHDNWLSIRNNRCFDRDGQTLITHGGSHFFEMAIPFVKI